MTKISDAKLRKLCLKELPPDVKRTWRLKESGVVDAKSLIKAVPKVVALIREGKSDVNKTAKLLTEAALGPAPHIQDVTIISIGTICDDLADEIIPEGFGHETLRKKLSLQTKINYIQTDNKSEGMDVSAFGAASKQAISKYKHQIVDLYGGNEGKFQRACRRLLNKEEELYDFLASRFVAALKRLPGPPPKHLLLGCEIARSLQQILNGLDRKRATCWECGAVATEENGLKIMACTQCNIARYCSKSCQCKAWKEGHRKACLVLKDVYSCFLQNMRLAGEACDNSEGHEIAYGIRPNSVHDFEVAAALCDVPSHLAFGGASLAAFYENLGKVNAGTLWMDPVVQIARAIAPFDGREASVLAVGVDHPCLRICQSLAFDYSSIECFRGVEESRAFGVVWAILGGPTSQEKEYGLKTREGFLHDYNAAMDMASLGLCPVGKLNAKAKAFDTMKVFHKSEKNLLRVVEATLINALVAHYLDASAEVVAQMNDPQLNFENEHDGEASNTRSKMEAEEVSNRYEASSVGVEEDDEMEQVD